MQNLLITNAQIATSAEVFCGSVYVENGKISRILRETLPHTPPANTRVINATGKYLLPGGVDPHTHFDLDVGIARASDDFYTGTIAAAYGGTTTVIDHMAFGPKSCALTHQPKVYHKLAKPSVIDYGFHGVFQHVDDAVLKDMKTLRDDEGISSFKLYMTYADMLNDKEILAILKRAKELNLVICAHCENDTIVNAMRTHFIEEGKTSTHYHPLSRPIEAEAEAIFRLLMLARTAGEAKVYVVHLSSLLGLRALRAARGRGQTNIFAETCPQYLLLDEYLYDDPIEGLKYTISPPLRKREDLEALWNSLCKDDIDTIGTDHCPFFFETQKQLGADNFTLCPNGAPGVELRMPLLFSEGFMKNRLSLPEIVRLCCSRPAEIFGISPQKGNIQEGADADLVLFDPKITWTATHSLLHENVDYTPYEGIEITGAPIITISRGEIIVENGEFKGKKGRGKYLHRYKPVTK